jgi:quercetin dioxygenase-like cupin family protein
MAGPFSMVNQIVDFPPNASTALHVHGGPGMATVLDGELVFRPEGKVNQPAKPGDVYLDVPGTPHRAVNEGSTPARLSFAVVVPQGAGVTTPLQQVSPPAAGPTPGPGPAEPGAAPVGMPSTGSAEGAGGALPLLVVVGLLLVAAGARLLRRQRQP